MKFSNMLLVALAIVYLGEAAFFESEDGSTDFILGEPVEVAKTDAGEIRALMGSHALKEHNVAFGFVTMEPRALLLPHYMDASTVFYVQQGEAMVAWVRGKEAVKKDLKTGDVYALPAGAVLYVLNTNEEQKLKMVGVFDTSDALHKGRVESFFIGGGIDPKIILAGFNPDVLTAAFKVSREEIENLFSAQSGGPIIRTSVEMFDGFRRPDSWSFLESITNKHKKDDDKHKKDDDKHNKDDDKHKKDDDKDDKKHKKDDDDKKHKKKKDEIFNLFERRAFENEHGWIASTLGEEVSALKAERIGVSIANLHSGCLLAPHWNPQASEFGVVTKGSGIIQIAYPNGTNAANEGVVTGTVFYVPQFLPVSQVASKYGSFEFVTFTVSSGDCRQKNRGGLQFLAGSNSVFKRLDLGTLALAFGVPDRLLSSFLDAQDDAVILSSMESSTHIQ